MDLDTLDGIIDTDEYPSRNSRNLPSLKLQRKTTANGITTPQRRPCWHIVTGTQWQLLTILDTLWPQDNSVWTICMG